MDFKVDDSFGYWLSGLTDGEGYFSAHIYQRQKYKTLLLQFIISLRSDDSAILHEIAETLKVGYVHTYKRKNGNSQSVYIVIRTANLNNIIVPFFEKFPLKSKKSKVFEFWKQIVDLRFHSSLYTIPNSDSSKRGRLFLSEKYWKKVNLLIVSMQRVRKFSDIEMFLYTQ